jgi:hypothetical protein
MVEIRTRDGARMPEWRITRLRGDSRRGNVAGCIDHAPPAATWRILTFRLRLLRSKR